MVNVFSANYNSGFMKFHEATFPDGTVSVAHTFTITDTNEDSVFLFLENEGLDSPFGNLYVSD